MKFTKDNLEFNKVYNTKIGDVEFEKHNGLICMRVMELDQTEEFKTLGALNRYIRDYGKLCKIQQCCLHREINSCKECCRFGVCKEGRIMKMKGNALVKKLRIEKNLTQEELAKAVKVGRTTITMIESDENYVTSIITAKRLGKLLKFDWKLFFEELK